MKEKQKAIVLTGREKKISNRITASAMRAVVGMCITAGITGIFFALGGTPVFFMPIFAGCMAVLIIAFLEVFPKGHSCGMLLCMMTAAILFFISVNRVVRAIYGWSNSFLNLWNEVFGTFYGELAVSGYRKTDLIVTGSILAISIGAATCGMLKKQQFFLLTLTVFVPLCVSIMLSVDIPLWTAAILSAGWVCGWCYMSGPSEIRWEIVLLTASAAIAVSFFTPSAPFDRWQTASHVFRSGITKKIDKVRFGEDTLPEGNLREADLMLTKDDERLVLEMEHPSGIYLRGFIGSVYEGNSWKHFSAEAYGGDYSGMLSWLSKEGFHPGIQYADYMNAAEKKEKSQKVSVKNTGADRRYLYLPETAKGTEFPGHWKQDWYMESKGMFGRNQYSFTYYDAQENGELLQPEQWVYEKSEADSQAESFLQAEKVYRSFVYDNYLALESEQKDLIDTIFFNGETWEESEGLYSITSRIRTVLQILAEYKKIPAKLPAGRDFLSWFLKEGKEGNASYYATAAVLAYRAMGIPARYAEGYVLTKEQAELEKRSRVTLSGKNAHAWVEVYIDGMGWKAIEVTPGFYEELYEAEVMVAVPNDELKGTNGRVAHIPSSEQYELPEKDTRHKDDLRSRIGAAWSYLLAVIAVFLLLEVIRLSRILYSNYRYKKMSAEEKMYVLYREIIDMVGILFKGFRPDHPLDLPKQESTWFDIELYIRTVERMERMIYGQTEPSLREIPATEALALQLSKTLNSRLKWWQKFLRRYKKTKPSCI